MKCMRIFRFSSLAIGLLPTILTAKLAQAASLEILPVSQNAELGDSVEVQVVISELGSFGAPSLGAFNLNVSFDDTILDFAGLTFGDQLDVQNLGSIRAFSEDPNPNVGLVAFFEISLDPPGILDSFQEASFTLATLNFNVTAEGIALLNISSATLDDSLGNTISVDSILDAVINGTEPSTIPEPSTILGLLTLGGIVLGASKKKQA